MSVVGSAISDNARVAAPSGAVHAFDARSGRPLWSFDPIPRTPESASAQGWSGAIPVEGHANAWAPMSVDAARGLVFVPTTSPSPDFFGGLRGVFEVIAVSGNDDAQAMARGVFRATIPTMAGLVVALTGIYFSVRLGHLADIETSRLLDRLPLHEFTRTHRRRLTP